MLGARPLALKAHIRHNRCCPKWMAHIYFYLCLALSHNLFIFSAKEREVVVHMRKSTQQHQRHHQQWNNSWIFARSASTWYVCVCFDSWLFFAILTESARIFIPKTFEYIRAFFSDCGLTVLCQDIRRERRCHQTNGPSRHARLQNECRLPELAVGKQTNIFLRPTPKSETNVATK